MADKSVVLPILKFSYTTTSAERTSPLGWTHLSGGTDLAVVFDRMSSVDERSGPPRDVQCLKVQRGMEILVCFWCFYDLRGWVRLTDQYRKRSI